MTSLSNPYVFRHKRKKNLAHCIARDSRSLTVCLQLLAEERPEYSYLIPLWTGIIVPALLDYLDSLREDQV